MIIVDNDYAIETDTMGNYSLFRRKTAKKGKKAGEEKKDYVGHFSSLRSAVKAYVRDRFHSDTDGVEVSLADAVSRLEAIEKDAISKLGV